MALSAHELGALFDRHGAYVVRRCRQLLGPSEDALDAAQEVFLRALAARERFRGDAEPLTWLYRIATTYCLQQIRNGRRRAAKLELVVPPEEDGGADLETKLDAERLLAALDEDVQAIVVYRFVDGMTLAEVADVAGVSRRTVQNKIDRAREIARARAAEVMP